MSARVTIFGRISFTYARCDTYLVISEAMKSGVWRSFCIVRHSTARSATSRGLHFGMSSEIWSDTDTPSAYAMSSQRRFASTRRRSSAMSVCFAAKAPVPPARRTFLSIELPLEDGLIFDILSSFVVLLK